MGCDILLDAAELLELPFGIGDNLKNWSSSSVSARYDAANEDELFVPPLAVSKPFLFGRAFDTTTLDPKD